MTQRKIALVLGATGGIGNAMAQKLIQRGWQVRALHRRAGEMAVSNSSGIEWRQGDAMQAQDVIAAAEGVALIVHAVNPPGYRNWAQLVLPMIDNSIAAARASGARIVLPGTVYNYDADAILAPNEASPQKPVTRKGAIRVQLERRLQAAAQSGVRTLVVRAGDFFGPHMANSWFSQGLVKAGQPIKKVVYPGKRGIGHQWAYLPDVAETMMQLIEREAELGAFETFHMNGHWDTDGTEMVAAIGRASGQPDLRAWAFPWWLVVLGSPFVPLFREMREMSYLWRQPLHLDNRRLLKLLGKEPHTGLDEAVRAALTGIGCIKT
ncbi:short chain dehydrogenase family protein [Collimonas arenae]|uniref:Short chain dehydrogenase family protein n=1 Tax=Collimonas arenae TaxID=279058 RepID=A0A127QCV6_9BURK|nr:SDR family NAD(P)-dependent oxidoreductase [Collimonas arenae]AMO98026.1 short chain dehydrogenase family protein [Collimonas arenae]AMP07888.1 short chain dehydrogenase family protein [Collimonas arenae]